jgi:hypothetical protein
VSHNFMVILESLIICMIIFIMEEDRRDIHSFNVGFPIWVSRVDIFSPMCCPNIAVYFICHGS